MAKGTDFLHFQSSVQSTAILTRVLCYSTPESSTQMHCSGGACASYMQVRQELDVTEVHTSSMRRRLFHEVTKLARLAAM